MFSFIFFFFIKMCYTYFQALAQCEHTLTRLKVVREAVDDTAGAAQVNHSLWSNYLQDFEGII